MSDRLRGGESVALDGDVVLGSDVEILRRKKALRTMAPPFFVGDIMSARVGAEGT